MTGIQGAIRQKPGIAFTRAAMLSACLLLLAAGCSAAPAPGSTLQARPTEIVMPTAGEAPSPGPETEPAEEFESEPPLMTPWPEPQQVEYQGAYLSAALDKDPSKYPYLRLSDTPVETTWGSFRLPEGWSVQDAEGQMPVITDQMGRAVGAVYELASVPTEPYFSLKPESGTLIAWENPGWPLEARVLTYESDVPTVADGGITIIRQTCVITGGPDFDDGDNAYYIATCFSFDKAYVDGDKIEYVIPNQTIDEIVLSFIKTLE